MKTAALGVSIITQVKPRHRNASDLWTKHCSAQTSQRIHARNNVAMAC